MPDDHQSPLTPAEKALRALLRPLVREELSAAMKEIASTSPSALRSYRQVDLSIANICQDYRVGRAKVIRMIISGELPSHQRRTRGGMIGTFVRFEHAAKVMTRMGKS